MREERKATLLTLQFLPKIWIVTDLLPCTVTSASLTLFWGVELEENNLLLAF